MMFRKNYPCKIRGKINAKALELGIGCVVEAGASISDRNGSAEYVRLGDFCYIGRGVRITAPRFEVGDYTKIHSNTIGNGKQPLSIGRNCWIGSNVMLDSMGGLIIDDNVGIGTHSQIWTHIQFGDIVEGSRFFSSKGMYIAKDAWFVGHCIVSPVGVGEKSMALAGSVITKEMLPNHVYGGSPAKDLSDKLGGQFENLSVKQKYVRMRSIVDQFVSRYRRYEGKLEVVTSMRKRVDGVTYFNVSDRTYTKTYSEAEVEFLKANVPLVKFVPMVEK